MNRYCTTITVIHNSRSSQDAMSEATLMVNEFVKAMSERGVLVAVEGRIEHVSRYNTKFVTEVE